jgi:hypothetical protein
MNDTNGNGTSDIQDGNVRVTESNLTEDASGKTVKVADGSKFPEKVNNAPNRIRVRDDNGGELAYIDSVTGNTITLTENLSRVYKKDDNGKAEIGEVDLMKLVMDSPKDKPANGSAELELVTVNGKIGNVKLWADENKITEIQLVNNKLSVALNDLPKTVWVEARETDVTELALHKIVFAFKITNNATGKTTTDTVRATAVWAERSNFWDTAKTIDPPPAPPAPAKTLNGDEDEVMILFLFEDRFDSDLGRGTFYADGSASSLYIGNRCEQEFTLYPAGVKAYIPGAGENPSVNKPVLVDVSRQASWRNYGIQNGTIIPLSGQDIPTDKWNRNELANDDVSDQDEDNTPTNEHIYSIDHPSWETTAPADFLISRYGFKEFVRWKFDLNIGFPSNRNGSHVIGSRGTPLEPWHYLLYVKRNQKTLGQAGSYVWDEDAVSTSFAIPQNGNTGNGTCTSTPNADNGVTEGWAVTYNGAPPDTWTVTGTDGSAGTLAKQGNVWTGTASKGGSVRITITVTPGGVGFVQNDKFKFSTFKTGATKKNEIKTGTIDITAGP